MSYVVSYTTDAGEVRGGAVASAPAWADFADWAALLPGGHYPELRYLGAYGQCFPAAALADLEAELADALRVERPGAGVAEVGHRLLDGLRRRPAGATALLVTDRPPGAGAARETGEDAP